MIQNCSNAALIRRRSLTDFSTTVHRVYTEMSGMARRLMRLASWRISRRTCFEAWLAKDENISDAQD
jgi:hypothetical protein